MEGKEEGSHPREKGVVEILFKNKTDYRSIFVPSSGSRFLELDETLTRGRR